MVFSLPGSRVRSARPQSPVRRSIQRWPDNRHARHGTSVPLAARKHIATWLGDSLRGPGRQRADRVAPANLPPSAWRCSEFGTCCGPQSTACGHAGSPGPRRLQAMHGRRKAGDQQRSLGFRHDLRQTLVTAPLRRRQARALQFGRIANSASTPCRPCRRACAGRSRAGR